MRNPNHSKQTRARREDDAINRGTLLYARSITLCLALSISLPSFSLGVCLT